MSTDRKLPAVILFFWAVISSAQSIEIGTGAELNVGANSDICASSWGNITGNLTGSGTQCDGVLPVLLISFDASIRNERDVYLTWRTATEINNKGFDVERRLPGGEWNKIAFISGSGISNLPKDYDYTDKKLSQGKYSYRLKQTDLNGNTEYFLLNREVEIKAPGSFELSQNYPNPSNPTATIDYQIPYTAHVTIKIYDAAGREAAILENANREAGYYKVKFDGKNLASGIYFYIINVTGETDRFSATKKMLLIK